MEVLLAGELFQESEDVPQPYTKYCVFSGTSGMSKGNNWLTVYLYQVEVPLAGELLKESEDLPQPYTKCCVFSWD